MYVRAFFNFYPKTQHLTCKTYHKGTTINSKMLGAMKKKCDYF